MAKVIKILIFYNFSYEIFPLLLLICRWDILPIGSPHKDYFFNKINLHYVFFTHSTCVFSVAERNIPCIFPLCKK